MEIALRALEFIRPETVVGLGSGRAATAFIHALADRVRAGLRVKGVPTSEATATLARELAIPVIGLDEAVSIDVTVDGADEIDPHLNLIKGLGGALVRERIVAAASRCEVILVGPAEEVRLKCVPVLGTRKILPLEVVPFAAAYCRRRLLEIGYQSAFRLHAGQRFVSDNGNWILDAAIAPLANPASLEQELLAIPGIVGTGLFLGVADTVLIQDADSVRVLHRDTPKQ